MFGSGSVGIVNWAEVGHGQVQAVVDHQPIPTQNVDFHQLL